MRLKIITNNEIVFLHPENIVVVKTYKSKGPFVEISCANKDVYRFALAGTIKESERFIKNIERLVDTLFDGERDSYTLSLCEFGNIRFEKASAYSYIE